MFKQRILLLLSFVLCSISAFSQPVNDDCSGIIDLGEAPICPAVLDTFNNVGATESIISTDPNFQVPACFNGGIVQRDVWFSFTIPTDGSIVDFQVTITGVDGPNGSIAQPQVAVYRGDCLIDELQELDCATSGLGETEITIDLEGLTPGLEYFLRIEDWSATASSNEGDFVLCIEEFDPCFNLCETETTSDSCEGKLYDSGGPDGDYSNNENCTFTICPSEFHQCIFINVADFQLEQGFDNLTFYAGEDTNAPQIFQLSGTGTNFEVQATSDCVTVQFTSDGSVTQGGFFLEWMCSPDTCTVDPPSTCVDPTIIASLPYDNDDLSTCFAGNSITNSPCNDFFIQGEEVIFAYDSPGDECININITNSNAGTGVAVYNDCPNIASECIATAGGGFGQTDPSISAAFLETPGTYYILVANANLCTGFDIDIESIICPVILPPASECDNAVDINGCGNQPSIITVSQSPSDETDFTLGCWGGVGANNFTWFIFQAQEDGNFGFLANDNTGQIFSDIDINVWGPFDEADLACDGTLTEEPIRSTWSGASGATGLTDINPDTGDPVTDVCEGAAGDKFVSTIDVLDGEWYVILLNDFGGTIANGEISMDFTSTSDGVLGPAGENFSITSDTVICLGESVQLLAEGGNLIQWFPDPALSCTNCPNPIATVTETTTFQAQIFGACSSDTLAVEVAVNSVDAGPDLNTCIGEEIQITALANFAGATYEWTNGPLGLLSCIDCPNPVALSATPGTFVFEITAIGPSCSATDTMTLTVENGIEPDFEVSDDLQICLGDTVQIGGIDNGLMYSWTSEPAGFTSTEANPSVSPSQTTLYILEVVDTVCSVPALDSVLVEIAASPIISTIGDTTICAGQSTPLSLMMPEMGVTYSWLPIDGLDNASSANPIATPTETTTYTVTADRDGCMSSASITVTVAGASVAINPVNPICIGETAQLMATTNGMGSFMWTGNTDLSCTDCPNPTTTPLATTIYTVTFTSNDGCIATADVTVVVSPTEASELNVSVCEGETFDFNGNPLAAGTMTDFVFQTVNGCDSTVTVNVTGLPNTASDLLLEVCEGGSILFEGTELFGNTVTDFTFTSQNGCDSIVTVTVDALPNFTSELTLSACEGTTVDYLGTALSPNTTTDFTFTAQNGCDSIVSVTVDLLAAFTSELTLSACDGTTVDYLGTALSPNTTTDFTFMAQNGCDSIVSVTVDLLADFETTESISVCPGETADIFGEDIGTAGVFEMTFTAQNGCDSTHIITLTIFDSPEVSLAGIDPSCNAGTDGQVTANATGGLAPYLYTWNTNAITATISGVVSGIYSVTITDDNGCSAIEEIELFNPTPVETVVFSEPTCENSGFGTATVEAEGGTGAYTYLWSDGSTMATATDLVAGTYTVTVTDNNGCAALDTVMVEILPSPTCSASVSQDISIMGFSDGAVTVNVSGGQAPYFYEWSTGDESVTSSGLAEGDYTVTVVDSNGCSTECSIFLPDAICENFDDPGTICCDQVLCGPGIDPDPIVEVIPPSGGSGAIEILWMWSNVGGPFSPTNWTPIPGATSANYDPGPLSETTYFARCIRRAGCLFIESNIVEILVENTAVAEIEAENFVCIFDTHDYSAVDSGSDATYVWEFEDGTPATATGQDISGVEYNSVGFKNVTLIVNRDGCVSTDVFQVIVSSVSFVCTGNNSNAVSGYTPHSSNSNIYPNPTTGDSYLTLGDIKDVAEVTLAVYSISGIHHTTLNIDQNTTRTLIPISKYDNGIYVLVLKYDGETQRVFKLFKE